MHGLPGWGEWKKRNRHRSNLRPDGKTPIPFEQRCVSAEQQKRMLENKEFLANFGLITTEDFLEANESIAPSTMSCSLKTGSASVPYYFKPTSDQDLRDIIPFVLGTTFTAVSSSGSMNRTTPLAHPIYPSFYATNLRQKGIGLNPDTLMVATDETLTTDELPQPLPFFTLYDHYEIEVDYTSSPYPVLNDIAITESTAAWSLPPPASSVDGPSVNAFYKSSSEWNRYLTWTQQPQNDWITGIAGASKFQTGTNVIPGAADPENAAQFQGMPKIWLPNQLVRMTWHQVPWRYVYSPKSYLNRFLGHINQFDWFPIGAQQIYPAGSLLYLGYNPTSYMSPAAAIQQWANGITITSMLCDIDLIFLYTNRTQSNVPTVTNQNFIASGHNLEPYFPLRQYFYVYYWNELDLLSKCPYWFSFPIELLFTDPDTPGINNF